MNQMFPKGDYTKKRNQRRTKRLNPLAKTKEKTLQKDVEKTLDKLGVRWLHIPNEIYRAFFSTQYRVPKHIAYKVSGYIKGVPDLIVFLKDGRFFCLELKVGSNGATLEQKKFRDSVGVDNFFICHDIDEVNIVLQSYGVII